MHSHLSLLAFGGPCMGVAQALDQCMLCRCVDQAPVQPMGLGATPAALPALVLEPNRDG